MMIAAKTKAKTAASKQKHVVSCDFRSASRISNEDARVLTSIHEGFARNLTAALDALLGKALEVQLDGLDQLRFEEHIAKVPSLTCIVPFLMRSTQSSIIVEFDIELVFLMIDLLLGGVGEPLRGPRDLSEIEEEIVIDLFSLMVRRAEAAWRLPSGALAADRRVKPVMLDQYCRPDDKVTCLKFKLEIGGIAGSFQLILPSAFLNTLLQQFKGDQPQRRAAIRHFPRRGVRDCILDSDVEVAMELPGLKVSVKDLLALLPGSVLKLRASVGTPGTLVAGGQSIFEATPVRNGARKAAQIGRRVAPANLERV